jgi:hypothetical protein
MSLSKNVEPVQPAPNANAQSMNTNSGNANSGTTRKVANMNESLIRPAMTPPGSCGRRTMRSPVAGQR